MKTLKQMQAEIREVNEANGWFDDSRTFGDGMALLHSEVSEAFEAFREYGLDDATDSERHLPGCAVADWHMFPADDPPPPCTNPECILHQKPEGVGSEFADVLIRLLDEAERQGIDLDAEYARKIAYNRTRGHKHGGKRL